MSNQIIMKQDDEGRVSLDTPQGPLSAATLMQVLVDQMATEVTRRVLVQLGKANDEIPVTADAPVVAPTVEEEDPTVHIGKIGSAYSLGELRELGKEMIGSGKGGARDALIEVLTDNGADSLSSLKEENYEAAGNALQMWLTNN
ncbi:MAG TPA: hypothetical protein EYF98_05035 [Planctomycetes bacterium]|jgi:hypothetical protein|nr:hypothetical protein [Planctomycetota bacterium]